MLIWVSWFISNFLYGLFDIFIYGKISNVEIEFNKKTLFLNLIYAFLSASVTIILGDKYKMILTIILAIFLLKSIYKDSINKIVVGFVIMYISFAISEGILFVLLKLVYEGEFSSLLKNPITIIYVNINILLLSILLFSINFVNKLCSYILKWYTSKSKVKTIGIIIFVIIIMAYLLYIIFSNDNSIGYTIFTLLFLLGIVIFIVCFFNERANNNQLKLRYDQLYKYSCAYEKELSDKSKSVHEQKNQLIIIKNLIDTNPKEAINYIDRMLKSTSSSKNIRWLEKLKNIPYGGLKGLFYYKINEMLEKKINIYINISEDLSKKSLWKVYEENFQDITRVIGVYIDNAIEASYETEDKFFILDVLYENSDIIFVFSNSFNNEIDINKIDKEGFSSKGKGRGYGLSLVKDIIDSNDSLEQMREINGQLYVQKLILKTKK